MGVGFIGCLLLVVSGLPAEGARWGKREDEAKEGAERVEDVRAVGVWCWC